MSISTIDKYHFVFVKKKGHMDQNQLQFFLCRQTYGFSFIIIKVAIELGIYLNVMREIWDKAIIVKA
jgi:hypothetical protein